MLELDGINQEISKYLASEDEVQLLHKALKKQNSHLIFFNGNRDEIKSYCEKHRLNPDLTIICADVGLKDQLYNFLYTSNFKNYLLLQKGSEESNYIHLNFLIYLQRDKFNYQKATFDPENTFITEEIEDLFRSKKCSPQVRDHFSTIYNELVLNAIIHGETAKPKLRFSTFSNYLIFQIEDLKGSFEFEQLNKVFNSKMREVNPSEIRTAGIGLNIVFKYTSGLMYEVNPGKSTVVTFFLNLNRSQRECSFIFCRSFSAQEPYPKED